MRFTVQPWPQGGYIIVPHRQPPFPIIFASRAQALAYAATAFTSKATSPPLTATPLPPTAAVTWSSNRTLTSPPAGRRASTGAIAAEHSRRAGLTPQQHHLLLALRGHPAYPAVTITALAERLRIHHQSASCRVAHAVTRGLLRRRPDAVDRRLVLVSLTDAGARALDRVTHATQVESAAPQPATALIAATLPAAASSHIP